MSENGGYCKFCVLFARGGPTLELGVLVSRPLIDFKRATELSDHFHKKKFHKAAVQEAESFSAVMNDPNVGVNHSLSSHRSRLAAQNRLKLALIAETVLVCRCQGFALRGHHDDGASVDDTMNHGNFLALLRFRVQAGDCVLGEHLETAAKNARYTSKTVQNEMITISGNIIRRKILQMVKRAGFFSVIADEATDVANDEQLSICLSYVHNGLPCEEFLAFKHCESGVSGEAIADDILSKITEWQLQPQLLRGQAYHGAGAMLASQRVLPLVYSRGVPRLFTHIALHTD